MATVAQVAPTIQRVLTETADAVARPSGFVQRRSKLTGAIFCQALEFTWLSNPRASFADLAHGVRLRGVSITPQGIAEQDTPLPPDHLSPAQPLPGCSARSPRRIARVGAHLSLPLPSTNHR